MKKVKRNLLEEAAIKYHNFGFNVLPLIGKAPNINWDKWQAEIQNLDDIKKMNWNHSTEGIGGIAGINNIRFIDIDRITNWEILDIILSKLKLGMEYLWLVRSGSGNGAHIIFVSEDDERLFKVLGGKKGVYKLKLKIDGYCEHIEIRWSDSQTVLPPSKHPSGKNYQFIYDDPDEPPSSIETDSLIEFVKDLFQLEQKKQKVKPEQKTEKYNPDEIEDAIKVLAENLNEHCYNEWMEIGFSLASIGEDGRKYFNKLSIENDYYKDSEEEINKKYDSFLKDYDGRSTLGTLFFYAKKYGYNLRVHEKESRADFFKQTEEYLKEKYDFIYNTLKQKLYWKKKDETKFKEINDRDLATFYIELKSKQKINISYENLRRLLLSDFVDKIDPLDDYFNNLPEWERVDYIEMLANTITVEEGTEKEWKLCLKRWLIATVACALDDKVVNHTAIILQGPQGLGKTRWIDSIVPEKLKEYIFTGNITPNDKDSKLAVVKNFIINLDELETLNREEIGFLKSLMTQKDVELRKPYGYYEDRYKRRSSFIGSINKLEFLNDPTGSRRFLCFAVEKIDYEHKIDIDMVFAQALHLYNIGERYWFDKAENDRITQNNLKFTFQPLEEQLILERYEHCSKDDPDMKLLSTTEIASELMGEKPFNSNTLRQIGMVLNKYGFSKGSSYSGKYSVKKWMVKKKVTISIDYF